MKNRLEQQVQATLIGKGVFVDSDGANTYYVTFEFSDGTRYMFEDIRRTVYEKIISPCAENVGGRLHYEERKRKHKFISFHSAGEQSMEHSSLTYQLKAAIPIKQPGYVGRGVVIVGKAILSLSCLCLAVILPHLIGGWGCFICPFLYVLFFIVPLIQREKMQDLIVLLIQRKKMQAKTIQRMTARVIARSKPAASSGNLYVAFSFANGETRRWEVSLDIFGLLREGDAGVLTFREKKQAFMKTTDVEIISFEPIREQLVFKPVQANTQPEFDYPKIRIAVIIAMICATVYGLVGFVMLFSTENLLQTLEYRAMGFMFLGWILIGLFLSLRRLKKGQLRVAGVEPSPKKSIAVRVIVWIWWFASLCTLVVTREWVFTSLFFVVSLFFLLSRNLKKRKKTED